MCECVFMFSYMRRGMQNGGLGETKKESYRGLGEEDRNRKRTKSEVEGG